MHGIGERLFAWLTCLYPREFRLLYRDELIAFFRQDRMHGKYGSGLLRPVRFWWATVRDLIRTAWTEHRIVRRERARAGRQRSQSFARIEYDIRYAWRGLWASPGVTVSALAVLTLGIGAGTAVFSVVDAVALRGLPFADDSRLVWVAETELKSGRSITVAPQNFNDWVQRQNVFESMGAIASAGLYTTQDEPVEALRAVKVYGPLFDVLRVKAARGRVFGPVDEQPSAVPVAIISDQLWQRRFNADPTIIGRMITSTRMGEAQIVGVMPPGFSYPLPSGRTGRVDVWLPFIPAPEMLVRSSSHIYMLGVIARLKPGVMVAEAQVRMLLIRDALAAQYPDWFNNAGVRVLRLQDAIVGKSVRSWMLILLGAVSLVVLMACLNAANLVVARATVRRPELAVRAALGASRSDLARLLFTESLLLSAMGTGCGILAAMWGVQILRTTLPDDIPRLAGVTLDLRVLAITSLAAMVSGVVFGSIPALQSSRPDLIGTLGQGGRSHSGGRSGRRLRSALVVVEVTLAVVLLCGSTLFFASFLRVRSIDLQFDPTNVVVFLGATMNSDDLKPPKTREAQVKALSGQSLVEDALARVRTVPGVVAAAAIQDGSPLSGSFVTVPVELPGEHRIGRMSTGFIPDLATSDAPVAKAVGPGYLDVMKGTLISGRWIAESDLSGTPAVVVISDDAARPMFGSRNPVGAVLRMDGYARTVVGVVKAMRWRGPEFEIVPELFVPFAQTAHPTAQLIVRTRGAPEALAPVLTAVIREALPGVTMPPPQFVEGSYTTQLAQRRFNMVILTIFGTVAVAIAAIGIYGLMAFHVAQRRREIGVRVALGAVPSGILSMMLGRAMRLVVVGLVPGITAAVLLERAVRGFLFDARPYDPAMYGAVALVFVAAGLAAAIGPARKATRVDPLVALRQE